MDLIRKWAKKGWCIWVFIWAKPNYLVKNIPCHVGQLSQIYLYDIYFNHSGAISLAKSCAMSDMPRQHTRVGTLFIMF